MLLFFLLFSFIYSEDSGPERIKKIPNFSGSIPSMYSGYITTNQEFGRSLYYMFVESESGNDTDPVILWLQGGPGCSSLMAAATEHGPITLNDDGSVVKNDYSLHRHGHVLYLDSPAGIGYSLCEDHQNFLNGSDFRTTEDTYIFLQEFFTNHFPQYKNNDFYIFGESYSGIYIPWLGKKIYNENNKIKYDNSEKVKINLKGLFMSNAVINYETKWNTKAQWFMFHGLISPTQYKAGYKACDGDFFSNRAKKECKRFLDLYTEQLRGTNILHMYTDCYGGVKKNEKKIYSFVNDVSVECINTQTSFDYFNSKDALEDFHVSKKFIEKGQKWEMCSEEVELEHNYLTNQWSVVDFVEELVNDAKYRIFMASGDVDACISTYESMVDSEDFLDYSLDWPKWNVTTEISKKQIAGYYRCNKDNTFCLATVRGAGHMISTYKPFESDELYKRFFEKTFPN